MSTNKCFLLYCLGHGVSTEIHIRKTPRSPFQAVMMGKATVLWSKRTSQKHMAHTLAMLSIDREDD